MLKSAKMSISTLEYQNENFPNIIREEIVQQIIDIKGRRIGADLSTRELTVQELLEIDRLNAQLFQIDERDRKDFSRALKRIESKQEKLCKHCDHRLLKKKLMSRAST